jgi:hypothetical protein
MLLALSMEGPVKIKKPTMSAGSQGAEELRKRIRRIRLKLEIKVKYAHGTSL